MDNDVNKTIDAAIERLADKVKAETDQNKALHFSQSALNLAQTKSVLSCCKPAGSSEPKK